MKISIITACYNSEKYIEDTMKSVLSQKYEDIEYIIVDGDSKDKTVEIIKKYEPLFNGRMKWISEKDKGIYDAMNKGLKMATGDYIGLINSDDYIANDEIILNISNEILTTDSEVIYGNLEFIDPTKGNRVIRKWEDEEFNEKLIKKGWYPAHPTLYVKKEIYEKIGLFSLDYKIAADYELMLRIFEIYRPRVSFINETFIKMRVGGVSTQGIKSKITIIKECSKAWKKNHLKKPILFDFIRLFRKLGQIF